MNILTFDIEEWFNCDVITGNLDWNNYEVRIYEGVDRILEELDKRQLKGTFFCLGWIAEHHPDVIRKIHFAGHQIGCHTYQHRLLTELTPEEFRNDTIKAKALIEDVIGEKIECFRAPAFSLTRENPWVIEILCDLGFKYDCSIFPAVRDYGGMPDYGCAEPAIVSYNGKTIKEFPINYHSILGQDLVFSGGGYFRLFPYCVIKCWGKKTPYMMSYFHPRDFDPDQPVLDIFTPFRKFKTYVGLKSSFSKFQRFLDDFEFVNIQKANDLVNWDKANKVFI